MTSDPFSEATKSYSVCCTPESPDYSVLTPEEKQRFGYIVHQLRKQGMSLKLAQELAYSRVMCEDIPFESEGR